MRLPFLHALARSLVTLSRGARRERRESVCSLNIRNRSCKKKSAFFSRRDCSGRVATRSDQAWFRGPKKPV